MRRFERQMLRFVLEAMIASLLELLAGGTWSVTCYLLLEHY